MTDMERAMSDEEHQKIYVLWNVNNNWMAQLTTDLRLLWPDREKSPRHVYEWNIWQSFVAEIPRTLPWSYGARRGDTFYEMSKDIAIGEAGFFMAFHEYLLHRDIVIEELDEVVANALA